MDDAPTLDLQVLREAEASCVCLRLQRAARVVGRRYDDAFRSLGLNNWQFSLLAAIGASEAPSVGELADFLGMDRTTMTRNLGVLQRRTLLTTRQDPRDGRVKRVCLTAQGRALLPRALERWRGANAAVEATVPPGLREPMRRVLGSLGRS